MGLSIASLVMFLSIPGLARAQWSQTSGPSGIAIDALHRIGETIYAGAEARGVQRSTDAGSTWIAANAGIATATVASLASGAGGLFAGTFGAGVFRSTNGGQSWTPANSGIETQFVSALCVVDPFVFAGTIGNSVYRSSDNGASWTQINSNMGLQSIGALLPLSSGLFVAGDVDVYRSTDNGDNWATTPGAEFRPVHAFAQVAGTAYAGTLEGILRSKTGGTQWTFIPISLPSLSTVRSFTALGDTVFAGASNGGVYVTVDEGLHWAPASGGIETKSVNALLTHGPNLLAGTTEVGVYESSNRGASWVSSNAGMPPASTIDAMFANGSSVFAGTHGDGVHRTNDNGATWTKVGAGNTLFANSIVFAISSSSGALLAGTGGNGLFRSSDDGVSWSQVTTGLPGGTLFVGGLTHVAGNAIAGTSEGLFKSSDGGASWTATNIVAGTVFAAAANATTAFAFVSTGFGSSSGVYRSTNGGATWLSAGLGGVDIVSLVSSGTTVLAGDLLNGLFRSTNNGVSWGASVSGIPSNVGVFALAAVGADFYAGTEADAANIYRSTNGGATWLAMNSGLEPETAIQAIASNSLFVFAGSFQKAVWRMPLAGAVGFDVAGVSSPNVLVLGQNAPNPFRGSTRIPFQMSRRGSVGLTVYDLSGREVGSAVSGVRAAGSHDIAFDATGLAPGTYFYRIESGTNSASKKMIVIK